MINKLTKIFTVGFFAFLFLVGLASASEICGDVNDDEAIDNTDLQVVNDYLFEGGSIDNFFTADMNWDRFIDILDYSLLNNYLNGGSNPAGCDLKIGDGIDGCIQTNDFEDSQIEVLSHDHEITLEELLASRNYNIDVSGEQTQIQTLTTHNEVEIEFRVLKMVAAYPAVFGYYTNGNVNSFVPLFESADHPDYNLPVIHNGDTFKAEFPSDAEIGFAIDVQGTFNDSGFIYSENSLNIEGKDHVLIYDASRQNTNSEFVLAFEDTFKDWDYQDLVVVVKRTRCGPEQESVCGNNVREPGEQCDDGNIHSGDGCDAECFIEEEILCYVNSDCGVDYDSDLFCSEDNAVKTHTTYTCNNPGQANSYCSNSTKEVLVEECSHMCMEGECHEHHIMCGDGIIQASMGEQCDDGNLVNGDGCSNQCIIEIPAAVCGNDIVENGEICDEGSENGVRCNNNYQDCSYCSNQCLLITLDEKDHNNDNGNDNGLNLTEMSSSFCSVNWKCTGWSECSGGTQTRICEDTNHCNLEYNKPYEETSCTINKVFVEEEKPTNYLWLWLILAILLIALITLAVNWN